MLLTRKEYEVRKESFLDAHRSKIRKLVHEKKSHFMDEQKKSVSLKDFLCSYSGPVAFLAIIAYFLWAKDIISLPSVAVSAFLAFVIYTFVYDRWKHDMETAYLNAFSYNVPSIIQEYMHDRMVEDVKECTSDEDFYIISQFYSIALYEIPNEFYINVYQEN